MKKISIITAAILILGAGGFYLYKGEKKLEKPVYKQVTVKEGRISEYIETTGQVQPLNRVEILPPSSGRIEKIQAEEGREVKNGEVLALMSSTDRVAILDAARAMSEKDYAYWQDSYKPIKIIAPLSGRIILRNIVEGQTVSGGTVLFAMSDMLIVMANVDEADIGSVKTGQKAIITLDAYPTRPVNGKVFQILDEGKNSSNVIIYQVKIKLDEVPSFFKSQMTANLKIETAKNKKVLLVPSKAINYFKDGKTYVITGFGKNGNPVETTVVTGNDNNGRTEITGGLEEGGIIYMQAKDYQTQNVSKAGSNPLMPGRPGGQGQNRNAQRAMRGMH